VIVVFMFPWDLNIKGDMTMRYSSFFLFVFLIIAACTNNPFFVVNTARDTHIVRGKVLLESGESPKDIYVWLEKLNISTRTNDIGDFQIELPRTDELSGYNDDLKLYYYVGNYAIEYSDLLVVDGIFQFDKYDVNNEGFLKETIILTKLIDIATTLEPSSISADYTDSMKIEVEITNLDTDLLVIGQMKSEKTLSGFIFREINSPATSAKRLELYSVNYAGYWISSPVTWIGTFAWPINFLPVGTYEVYPYVFLHQEEIPQELLDSFGNRADRFTDAYLKIPFTHNSDILIVN